MNIATEHFVQGAALVVGMAALAYLVKTWLKFAITAVILLGLSYALIGNSDKQSVDDTIAKIARQTENALDSAWAIVKDAIKK